MLANDYKMREIQKLYPYVGLGVHTTTRHQNRPWPKIVAAIPILILTFKPNEPVNAKSNPISYVGQNASLKLMLKLNGKIK